MALPAILMLDTNIASYIAKGRHAEAIKRHIRAVPSNRLCFSTITEAELRVGLALNPKATRLTQEVTALLNRIEALPWDSDAAEQYASIGAQLSKVGTPIGQMDLLIAAHALAVGATLVTNDKAFRHVVGLKTVDWTKP